MRKIKFNRTKIAYNKDGKTAFWWQHGNLRFRQLLRAGVDLWHLVTKYRRVGEKL